MFKQKQNVPAVAINQYSQKKYAVAINQYKKYQLLL